MTDKEFEKKLRSLWLDMPKISRGRLKRHKKHYKMIMTTQLALNRALIDGAFKPTLLRFEGEQKKSDDIQD